MRVVCALLCTALRPALRAHASARARAFASAVEGGGGVAPQMSHTALDALTVVKLKDLLRSRGQPVSGVKAALIERLLEPVSAGPVEGSIASPPSAPKSPARAPRAPARSASSARAKSARVGKRPHGGTGLNSAREAELPSGEVTRIGMDPTPGPEERGAGENSAPLRIASWNVAGLRGLLGGKNSEQGREALRQLVGAGGVDVLLLQETKLQQMHITDVEAHLFEACAIEAGAWRAAWACSAARKGYAGVAVLWRVEAFKRREHFEAEPHCAPLPIDPSDVADQEGRTLRLEIPLAAGRPPLYLVNVYTPNSGAELKRLEYRVHGWDVRFRRALAALHLGDARREHLRESEDSRKESEDSRKESTLSPVVAAGDFNVAVEDADFWNPDAKHVAMQAGTTPAERASFRDYLGPITSEGGAQVGTRATTETGTDTGTETGTEAHQGSVPPLWVDAFRHVHPEARGHFSFWSQRARNRAPNRGLRLDYFLLSRGMLGSLYHVEHRQDLYGSDHCPVVIELDMSKIFD